MTPEFLFAVGLSLCAGDATDGTVVLALAVFAFWPVLIPDSRTAWGVCLCLTRVAGVELVERELGPAREHHGALLHEDARAHHRARLRTRHSSERRRHRCDYMRRRTA